MESAQSGLTLAFLVHKGACHLALTQDVKEGLLRLTSGLSQGKPFCNGGHEAALYHVENQHHPCCIPCFT